MNSTSEYLRRAEAYRAKAQECQRWLDRDQGEGEEIDREIDRVIEARDAFEAAAERAEGLAEMQRALNDREWVVAQRAWAAADAAVWRAQERAEADEAALRAAEALAAAEEEYLRLRYEA